MSSKKRKISPARTVLFTMFITILIGTGLLALPISRNVPIPFIDLFFTSTSATCVTGLLSVPLSSFTTFGQSIILALLQIGGLGVITLTLFILYFITNLGLSSHVLAGQVLELGTWKTIKRLLIVIIILTLIIEILGATSIFFSIKDDFSTSRAIFISIFQSISSFCNTGFSLFGTGSLTKFSHNYQFLGTSAFLIISGGLGFITWHEIIQYISTFRKKRFFNFSLHSKIVFYSTFLIIILTTLIYLLLEYNNSMLHMPFGLKLINSFFNAVASRSTGFTTVPINLIQLPTLFLIMIISFIGSSPGSTGSGIKITTFAIFIASIKSVISDRSSVEILGRRIAKDQINRAIAVVSLSVLWLSSLIFFLLILETGFNFVDICLEAFSSFTNLGLSIGITEFLSSTGKSLLIISMIVGRIGSLTLMLALIRTKEKIEYAYPEERVLIS